MYFRILVNKNGDKFFRTSRLHSAKAALEARQLLVLAVLHSTDDPMADWSVTVLQVNDIGEGAILAPSEVEALAEKVMNDAEDASEGAKFI